MVELVDGDNMLQTSDDFRRERSIAALWVAQEDIHETAPRRVSLNGSDGSSTALGLRCVIESSFIRVAFTVQTPVASPTYVLHYAG